MIVFPDTFQNIKSVENNILVYPNEFNENIINNINDDTIKVICKFVKKATGLSFVLDNQKNYDPIYFYIILEDSIYDDTNIPKGSVIITKNILNITHTVFLVYDFLKDVYISVENRLKYINNIRNSLVPLKKLSEWEQCIKNYIELETIGKGSFAEVYKAITNYVYAVKITKIKDEAYENPFDNSINSWNELTFLKLFTPLIENKVCPHLPYLIDYFTCAKTTFNIRDEKYTDVPSITFITELSLGTLKDFLNDNPNINLKMLENILFQVMVALHTIQYNFQIQHFDIKKENVLIYRIKSGGYWRYIIHGKEYYLENLGILCVLNDFGVSRIFSPSNFLGLNMYSLGSRYAFVINKKFVPISGKGKNIKWIDDSNETIKTTKNTSLEYPLKTEIKYNKTIKSFLKEHNIQNPLFESEIMPPFEFFNDTQDVLRMFSGNKRTTQKSNHSELKFKSDDVKQFLKKIKPYISEEESSKSRVFSTNPNQCVAGYFIEDYFEHYLEKHERIIESYRISKNI